MRVAVVAYEPSRRTDRHGVDRQGVDRTEAVARDLSARGHEVLVFTPQFWHGADAGRTHRVDGVTYRRVDVAPRIGSFVARLPWMLARYRPDAVHATPAPPSAALAARTGATLARAPLVLDWFGDEPLGEARWIERAARSASAVVAPSRFVASRVETLGVPADRTRVIPEWVDFETIESTPPADDAPDVVTGRSLDEAANLESVFLALAELRDRDWELAVVGDGPDRARYEQEAADLRIDDRVRFVGDASRERRVALYRGAHVAVHTATREFFPTELLWALACGCVGIVEYQKESSAHELVERRERGFRATTPEEVADAVVSAGDMPRKDVDEAFREFDREAVLESWLDCYRDLGAGE
jgi:glycosyltransferase involved in cell wall biosynthesis